VKAWVPDRWSIALTYEVPIFCQCGRYNTHSVVVVPAGAAYVVKQALRSMGVAVEDVRTAVMHLSASRAVNLAEHNTSVVPLAATHALQHEVLLDAITWMECYAVERSPEQKSFDMTRPLVVEKYSQRLGIFARFSMHAWKRWAEELDEVSAVHDGASEESQRIGKAGE